MKPGWSVIACLLLGLAILLQLPLIIYPPRAVVFPLPILQRHGEVAHTSYVGVTLELQHNEVQGIKARLRAKIEEARRLLAVARSEESDARAEADAQVEAAIAEKSRNSTAGERVELENYAWNQRIATRNQFESWNGALLEAEAAIREAEAAVESIGEQPALADLKRAGQLTNSCLRLASEAGERWQ
jgi:hypothetical protein